jgi:hypothetical protein
MAMQLTAASSLMEDAVVNYTNTCPANNTETQCRQQRTMYVSKRYVHTDTQTLGQERG